jgi:hypothetical protein
MRFQPVISLLLLLLIASKSQGQNIAAPEALHYQQILQGVQYNHYYPAVEGNQYWIDPVYSNGSIKFEGTEYQDLLLNYDVYNQLVMTAIVQDGFIINVILDKSRIDRFSISQDQFIHIREGQGDLLPGFYRLCFEEQDMQLYALNSKDIVGNNFTGALTKKFVQHNELFLVLDDKVFKVDKKKDLRLAFSGKPEMINFMKQSGLRFNKVTLEQDLVRFLSNYYQSDSNL